MSGCLEVVDSHGGRSRLQLCEASCQGKLCFLSLTEGVRIVTREVRRDEVCEVKVKVKVD